MRINPVMMLALSLLLHACAALSTTPSVVEIKTTSFDFSLPEEFGDTSLRVGVSEGRLSSVSFQYKNMTAELIASSLKKFGVPVLDSLSVAYEDIDSDQHINTFAICFYTHHSDMELLGSDYDYVIFSVYDQVVHEEVITKTSKIRRCTPKPLLNDDSK